MAKEWAKKFYGSEAWSGARAAYISSRISVDGGMCERCHQRLGYIVHHKVYLTPANINDPEVSLNHANLEYLCHECHDDEHLVRSRLFCTFDENGRPVRADT